MLATHPPTDAGIFLQRVAWTRGDGCHGLAAAVSAGPPIQIGGDLTAACVAHKVDAVVSRRLTRFDLVPNIVPSNVNLDQATRVTVAVGDGPHSPLATALGASLATALGVPGEIRTVFRRPTEAVPAAERLEQLAHSYPHLDRRLEHMSNVDGWVSDLSPSSVLVIGAAGGSWIQRQLFGPGHRLRVAAPGGVIIVRSTSRRCFQEASLTHGSVVSPHLTVGEARRLVTHAVTPVANDGTLVGLLRRSSLEGPEPETPIGRLLEPPVAVEAGESTDAVRELAEFLNFSPVPVVASKGRLIGTIDPQGRKGAR